MYDSCCMHAQHATSCNTWSLSILAIHSKIVIAKRFDYSTVVLFSGNKNIMQQGY